MNRRFNRVLLPLAVLALALPACSSHAADSAQAPATAPATHPVSGLPVIPSTIERLAVTLG